MSTTVEILRKIAKEFNDSQSEKRISVLHDEVRRFISTHAHMGHYGTRFDVFWDNNEETRKVCKMLAEEGILSSILNLDETDITEVVLKNEVPQHHWLEPNDGIMTLFLSWD